MVKNFYEGETAQKGVAKKSREWWKIEAPKKGRLIFFGVNR